MRRTRFSNLASHQLGECASTCTYCAHEGRAKVACQHCGKEYGSLTEFEQREMDAGRACPADDCPGHEPTCATPDCERRADPTYGGTGKYCASCEAGRE